MWDFLFQFSFMRWRTTGVLCFALRLTAWVLKPAFFSRLILMVIFNQRGKFISKVMGKHAHVMSIAQSFYSSYRKPEWKTLNQMLPMSVPYTIVFPFQVQFNAYFRMPSLMATIMMSVFGLIFAGLASFGIGRSILKAVRWCEISNNPKCV